MLLDSHSLRSTIMMARRVVVVLAVLGIGLSSPAWAQRGGGSGAGCSGRGGGGMAASANYAASTPYTQNPLATQYALQQMQQQYMQQLMAMRQQYMLQEMQKRQLQMRGQQANQQLANSKSLPQLNAQGDSTELLSTRTETPTRSKARKSRVDAQQQVSIRAKQVALK